MPSMENMRVPLERLRRMEIPRIRSEDMDFPRMKLEEMMIPRMRIEGAPRLRDGGGKIRIYSPSQFGDGEYRTYIIGPGGELKLERSEAAKKTESAAKAKKEKATKK